MSFFNDAQKDALLTGRYICSKCGARMQFEDEWEDDEEYEALYPTREEVCGEFDED